MGFDIDNKINSIVKLIVYSVLHELLIRKEKKINVSAIHHRWHHLVLIDLSVPLQELIRCFSVDERPTSENKHAARHTICLIYSFQYMYNNIIA